MAKVKILFFPDSDKDAELDMEKISSHLRAARKELHKVPAGVILDFFESFSKKLAGDKGLQKKAGVSLKDLIKFLSGDNLGRVLDLGLRDKNFLDKFIKPAGADFFLHAQPRGLVVEWLAGNIPFLGIYSLAEVLLTKNALLIKAPSGDNNLLVELLKIAESIAREKSEWQKIINAVAVVMVDRDDLENQKKLSLLADMRFIWGGEESTKQILFLPKNFWTEDIVYGPKYSYAVLDKEVSFKHAEKMARALALDIANFDQYACSSPHTIFVEEGGEASGENFAKMLAKELDLVGRLLPKGEIGANSVQKILTVRADYSVKGLVFAPASQTTEWTVIFTAEKGLGPLVASRVVFVKPVKNLKELGDFNDRKIQTIGWGMESEENLELADELTLAGGDRLPKLGEMSFFASPWDGLFAIDRLVRWVRLG